GPGPEGPRRRRIPKDPCRNPQAGRRGRELPRSREAGQAVGSAALLREPLRWRRPWHRRRRQYCTDIAVSGPVLVLVEFRPHPRLLGLLPIARSGAAIWR